MVLYRDKIHGVPSRVCETKSTDFLAVRAGHRKFSGRFVPLETVDSETLNATGSHTAFTVTIPKQPRDASAN